MKVTRSLLEKYAKGLCSPEEQKIVAHWLEHGDRILPEAPPSLDSLKASVWEDLLRKNSGLDEKRKAWRASTFLRYAASVVMLAAAGSVVYWFVLSNQQQDFHFANRSNAILKQTQVDGFDVTMGRRSSLHLKRSFTEAEVGLCGDLMLTNHSGKDRQVHIRATCGQSRDEVQVNINSNRSYYAVQLDFSDHELLVIDSARVFDLPPRVIGEIQKAFDI